MKRKIIKQGHNTLTMTLPSDWIKKQKLCPGDEVDLVEKETGLFITTSKHDTGKKIEFDVTGLDIPTIWKYFMGVYREGYDEVLIKFQPELELDSPYKYLTQHRLDMRHHKQEIKKKKAVEALEGFVHRFIGFEVVEHGRNFILVKDLGNPTIKEFDNSLRRVFLLIQQMAAEIIEAIEKNDSSILRHTADMDITIDKFHDYCIRVLNKTGYKETRKTSLLFTTLYLLEMMGDEYKNISIHLMEDYPKSKFGQILPLAQSVKEQMDSFYELFYTFKKENIEKISKIDEESFLHLPEIYTTVNEEGKEIFHHFRIIGRYINSLIELRIEMEF